MRQVEPRQRIGVLRALARCIALDASSLDPRVRISETSRIRSKYVRLEVELPAPDFWRAIQYLREGGYVDTGAVYDRHGGPGILEQVRQDSALALAYALATYIEMGYPVDADRGAHDMPSGIPSEELEYIVRWRVNRAVFDDLLAHLPPRLAPQETPSLG